MIRLFFSLPPVVYFVLGIALAAFGYYADQTTQSLEVEKAQAREGEPPAVVDLGSYDRSVDTLAKEVNVAAQFNQEHSYILYEGAQSDSNAHVLYMLFDPAATEAERSVQAAIVVRENLDDKLYDWMVDNIHGDGALSPIFHMNGTRSSTTTYGDIASDAIKDNGFTKASGFFYLKPFIDGREAGLAPSSNSTSLFMVGLIGGLIIAAIGLFKILMRRRRAA